MKFFKVFVLYVIIILILLPNTLHSQKIKDIKLNTNENHLIVSASVDTHIPDEIIDLLKNGVKITIVYYIHILEKRPFWLIFDKTIYEKSIKKVVTYNIWEKNFYLKEGSDIYKIKTEKELQNRLMNISNIKLIKISKLKAKKGLYLKIKAKLESIKLFPPLSWIYDLVITRSFETPWKKKRIE